ncbi:MAG: DUF6119 family protein [Myroides sp.]
MYSIIGGNSFRIIQPFLEPYFGINLYSRILDPENDELLSIKTRNIAGKIAAVSNHFKNNFKLIDHIKFGSVPNEISLKLSINHSYFDFLIDKNKPLQIHVSDSIKIKKNIKYPELIKIVKEIKFIEELEKKDYLTTYQKIDNQSLCDKLQDKLIERILHNIPNTLRKTINPSNDLSIEFCHPNKIEEFYEADYFLVLDKVSEQKDTLKKRYTSREELYFEIISRAVDIYSENITFDELKYYLFGVRIRSYKNESNINLTSAMFLHHVNTEFEYDDQPIFLLDNNYYFLKDSFIKDLNSNFERLLKNYKIPAHILNLQWDLKINNTEGKYNLLYTQKKNYLVLDTITIDGVELCDVIFYDDDNIYLIHVKRGFDSSMRELYNQIILSSRRLQESLNSKEKNYLKKSFKSLLSKNNLNENINFKDFKKLFEKKINYVMAFSNKNSNALIEDNIVKVRSSIAKFSIIQASSEMRANYYELYFTQILH